MLTLSMDVLFHSWDAQIATLAHRDAVGRGHPLHHISTDCGFGFVRKWAATDEASTRAPGCVKDCSIRPIRRVAKAYVIGRARRNIAACKAAGMRVIYLLDGRSSASRRAPRRWHDSQRHDGPDRGALWAPAIRPLSFRQ